MSLETQREALERLTDAMEQAKALYKSARQELKWAKALYKLGATRPAESSGHAMHVQTYTLRNTCSLSWSTTDLYGKTFRPPAPNACNRRANDASRQQRALSLQLRSPIN
jgi:hypothetical protein